MATQIDQLVKQSQLGDNESLNELISHYWNQIWRFVRKHYMQDADADDITQLVFIRVTEKICDVHPVETFRNWLYKVALNMIVDFNRREFRHRNRVSLYNNDPVHEHDGLCELLLKENRQFVDRGIRGISSQDIRETLLMRAFEQLPYEAIAQAQRIPVGTVKSRLHKARTELLPLKNQLCP
jgi:RNA polymerase sigma-70 factor, ECF subfamily